LIGTGSSRQGESTVAWRINLARYARPTLLPSFSRPFGAAMTRSMSADGSIKGPSPSDDGDLAARKRQRTSPGVTPPTLCDIELSKEEKELFETLKQVVKRFEVSTVVRVAGGWVRDKLLGRTSHDIDIALDDTSGVAFAELVNKYLTEKGHKTRRIGLIQANPEQSKHLETAAVSVLGVDVDFVNLRSESYEDSSRIPAIKFGTALEDAERRDFTINSLFFNVNEGKLEDLTGKGVRDLQTGIIRTPLPPLQTFHDDPLRMLRAIRFASRFKFSLHNDVVEALRDETNLSALRSKISRERIGTELISMLRGPHPILALDLLCEHKLMPLVFSYPEFPRPANLNTQQKRQPRALSTEAQLEDCISTLTEANWGERVSVVKSMLAKVESDAFKSKAIVEGLQKELVCLAGLFHGWAPIQGPNHKWRPDHMPAVMIRDGLKQGNSSAPIVVAIVDAAPRLSKLAQGAPDEACRLEVGRLMLVLKEHFAIAMVLASVLEPTLHDKLKDFDTLVRVEWNLAALWKEPLPYNGKQLIKALDLGKGGPHLGKILERQMDWVILDRSSGQDQSENARRDRCLAFLMSIKEEVLQNEADRLEQVEIEKRKEAEIKRIERDRRIREADERAALARKARTAAWTEYGENGDSNTK